MRYRRAGLSLGLELALALQLIALASAQCTVCARLRLRCRRRLGRRLGPGQLGIHINAHIHVVGAKPEAQLPKYVLLCVLKSLATHELRHIVLLSHRRQELGACLQDMRQGEARKL